MPPVLELALSVFGLRRRRCSVQFRTFAMGKPRTFRDMEPGPGYWIIEERGNSRHLIPVSEEQFSKLPEDERFSGTYAEAVALGLLMNIDDPEAYLGLKKDSDS
jgi:hypothetical protein